MRRKIGITPWAGLALCASLLFGVTACGDDSGSSAGTTSGGGAATHRRRRRRDHRRRVGGEAMKIGFITKFPVDFYDTMVEAAKDWNKDHPEVELIFAQGRAAPTTKARSTRSSRWSPRG